VAVACDMPPWWVYYLLYIEVIYYKLLVLKLYILTYIPFQNILRKECEVVSEVLSWYQKSGGKRKEEKKKQEEKIKRIIPNE